jgi:PAS domain S-box-containing protein
MAHPRSEHADDVQDSPARQREGESMEGSVRELVTDARAFEAMLFDISSKFVNLPGSEVDREIEEAQRRICECLGLDLSGLWQWSGETHSDLILTHAYRPPGTPPPPNPMNARDFCPWARDEIVAGRTVIVSSLTQLPAAAARDKETYEQFGIKSALTLPLSTGTGPTIGALSFNTTRSECEWPDAMIKRLHLVAEVFANAIARKRADETLRESEGRLKLATDAAGAGLWVMDQDGSSLWASARTRELFQFGSDQSLSYQNMVERIHAEHRAEVDLAIWEAMDTDHPHQVEVPLALPGGQTRWISAAGRWLSGPGGRRHLMGVFLDVTTRKQAEIVRREHDRMQRELDIAHRVQQSLLPREPLTIPGYMVAGWSEPATEAGGDYYDWLMLPDDRAIVAIADATGHGIGPALMVTICRAYFRAAAPVEEAIENLVARVNDLIAGDLQEGTFVTAAIAALDPTENLLHVYSAGHGPILYYDASEGRTAAWDSDTFPLGMFSPMNAGPSRCRAMEPGDMLLLTTDGFFEWENPEGEQYGIERLGRFLEQHRGSTPETIIRALHDDVRAFACGTAQMDDVTAVIIKRCQ